MINLTLRNKLKWNVNQNAYISIQENAFENIVCKIVAILHQPQYAQWVAYYLGLKVIYRDPV